MKIEAGKLRAPEIGCVWLNLPWASLKSRRRAALIDFWDSTLRQFDSCRAFRASLVWRYRDKGLSVMGFTRRTVPLPNRNPMSMAPRDRGLTYPAVVMESNYEIWNWAMASSRTACYDALISQEWCSIEVETDNHPYATSSSGRKPEELIPVSPARWYTFVNSPGFGRHTLEPLGPARLAAFAFTFTSCVDFSIAGVRTAVVDRS